MDRQRYRRMRRNELLKTATRVVASIVAIVGGYFLIDYVNRQSLEEVASVLDRPDSDFYLIVDDKVQMTVIDDEGNLSMVITGDEVRLTTDQKTAEFIGADAVYFEDGEESMWMTAGQINYDMDTEDFHLINGLHIRTREDMFVNAPEVVWRRAKNPSRAQGKAQVPSFSFPSGVKIVQLDEVGQSGNIIEASYMQADKNLEYMEFVGNIRGQVAEMKDTDFIAERELANVNELNFDDFETINFEAEQVIYDQKKQVVLATSRLYDREFRILDPDGREVAIDEFSGDEVMPVRFSKEEIRIECYHLEAHIDQKWASCVGEVQMIVPPAEPEEGDDRALKVVKRFETRMKSGEIEYFWGRDHIITHQPTRVEQEDRLALADRITYYGQRKQIYLDGNLVVVQGSGEWMLEEELISVDDHDQRRAVTSYSELYADRAVIYLDNNDFIAAGNVEMRQDERETTADTIVYQDEIKRITAQGNVRFRDKDDQTLLCGGLVYFNDSDYMEITGGASATLMLPARYANDINQSIADIREEDAPEPIEDEPLTEEPPTRNPNLGSSIAASLRSGPAPLEGVESTALENVTDNGLTPLPPLGVGNGTREIMLDFSDDEAVDVVEDAISEVNAAEAEPEDPGDESDAAERNSEAEEDSANVAEANNETAGNGSAGSESREDS